MKATVDRELCIGCGLCEQNCPSVFLLDAESKSTVPSETVSADDEDCVRQAQEDCPVSAISIA
ncbi:MAG: ferredoxin [Anaerofustis sp.]